MASTISGSGERGLFRTRRKLLALSSCIQFCTLEMISVVAEVTAGELERSVAQKETIVLREPAGGDIDFPSGALDGVDPGHSGNHLARFGDAYLAEVIEHLVRDAQVEPSVGFAQEMQRASPYLRCVRRRSALESVPVLLHFEKMLSQDEVAEELRDRAYEPDLFLEERPLVFLGAPFKVVDLERTDRGVLNRDVFPEHPGRGFERR